jgi:hypothetical protein
MRVLRAALPGILLLAPVPALAGDEAERFPTSLHATRAGKNHWYGAGNGGFEKSTGIPIEKLGCRQCHGPKNADGEAYADPYPGAGCIDCHASADQAVSEESCYGCHGRQAMESRKLKLPDVHRAAGLKCWDCHGDEDMHGDGTSYRSMLEPGAIRADCADCHETSALPVEHGGHDPHEGKLHCSACHAETVITCYNCHLESQVKAHVKRARQPLSGFVLLVNREKDGKVHPASFQSLTYEGKAFVALGPYGAHTIVKEGRDCADCHVGGERGGENAAIAQYNESGEIRLVELDAEGGLRWLKGIVPVPEDYRKTLKMEFLTFGGDPSTPAGQGNDTWKPIGKQLPDGSQMFFASPLSRGQMTRLGFASPGGAKAGEEEAAPADG